MSVNLLWLRRDLRLHDHAALHAALKEQSPVQPVFIFDTEILKRFDNPRDRRLTFIAEALYQLDQKLRERGGELLVFHGKATEIIPKLATKLNAEKIFAAEDFEPATRKRDALVSAQTTLELVTDHVMAHPNYVLKEDGSPFRVFTPYSKAWHAKRNELYDAERPIKDKNRYVKSDPALLKNFKRIDISQGAEKALLQINYRYSDLGEWKIDNAQKRLKNFIAQVNNYPKSRDMVAEEGTSKLSPYLRFGLISIRECLRAATEVKGSDKWISELIWRDFYQMILFHFPHTPQLEFQAQYQNTLPWRQDKKLLDAWKTGKTGYPIVDAAMRELATTGWMHNRARMIVASFLTKDLLIDWRLGEEHFAQLLMDYELASNVGGWQWAASTGTDAQPYFRIFNPVLQGKKFDPNGDYVRRFVPELKHLDADIIHEPWKEPLLAPDYPAPIVDHAEARDRALRAFKQVG